MSDLIKKGAAFLSGQLKASASSAVTYTRATGPTGVNLVSDVKATIGSSSFESQTQSGVIESWHSRDFIILSDDLDFEPQRGDTISELIDGVTGVFEVRTPRGIPLSHPADAFSNSTRIHTTRIN